jgi:signal transduction histidine kinase
MLAFRQRSLIVIASLGVACSALVFAGGWAVEWMRLGADDREAFGNVEQFVRSQFDRMTSSLDAIAASQVSAAEPVLSQPSENRDLRPLFRHAASAVAGAAPAPVAITLYSNEDTPLAWAGRPSELTASARGAALPPAKLAGPSSLFLAPGPLGFRLVRVRPVVTGNARPPARVGLVAVERLFSELASVGNASADSFSIETPLAPVTLRAVREGVAPAGGPFTFVVQSPTGDPLVEARVDPGVLQRVRREHRALVLYGAVMVLALASLLLAGPVLDARSLARTTATYLGATAATALLVVLARILFALALPPGNAALLSPDLYHWPALGPLARHPADLLLTSLAVLALVALAAGPLERRRVTLCGHRWPAAPGGVPTAAFVAWQVVAGLGLAVGVVWYEAFLAGTFRRAAVDILHFSPHPWDTARMAIAFALLGCHAAFAWLAVLLLRFLLARWRFSRHDLRVEFVVLAAWALPTAAVLALWWNGPLASLARPGALLVVAAIAAAAAFGPRGHARFRHASQGYRLIVAFFALLTPSVVMYPSLVFFHDGTRQRAIETVFGPEVLDQLDNLETRLGDAQKEIDAREPQLEAAVSVPTPAGGEMRPDSAFQTWQGTALERYRVSSAIELYNGSEMLVSRFALNLPEEASVQKWREEGCEWRTFVEISPFGSHERQLLHAGRNICGPAGTLGTIVIHVILDNSALSFISSQSPYLELLRSGERTERGGGRSDVRSRDVEFVVYGWSRSALYVSGDRAWPIDDDLFARIYASRTPFWTRMARGGTDFRVYIENDRSGIYALGYPLIPPIGHLINLAELAVLAALAYVGLLSGAALFRVAGMRKVRTGRALLREIRESFYRKLFLAFVAVSVVPVVALALVTRVYIADRLRADVESAAHKTTLIARQIIEEYSAQSQATLGDDAMVGLSRVIDQDVNVFSGAQLQATSERDLFASGLMPTRTPADVFRAIALDRMPTVITEEQVAGFRYIVAAAPLRSGARDAILTVPLTLRQQEIEREIDDLNRRLVLAAMLFILFGAAIGYPMAERIADPVNRLTRATRRIARGDFDARVAATSSDELRRLVDAFNRMSAELLRQRGELERTHRLEAWAEMARQVAHDIKNPLTPIQLSAEHLRRVHADRGKPLGPVLEGCVDSILAQVRLLRQLASEFSSFASSPTARIAPADVAELVDEVVRPYETGGDRWRFVRQFAAGLPLLKIDRVLVGRALTNVVDNALHAMPGGGTITLCAQPAGSGQVELIIADTGVGMDEEALERLFEPYFSTKAVGTGLGLSIARRNVELNAGTIRVTSGRGTGTRVTITLPTVGEAPNPV